MPTTAELEAVLAQSQDIAHQTRQPLGTAHALLALFTVPNPAEALLLARRVNEETVLAHLERTPKEPRGTFDAVLRRAEQLAADRGLARVGCLLFLAALTDRTEGAAAALLKRTGVDLKRLRDEALRLPEAGVTRIDREKRAEIDAELEGYIRDTVELSALPPEAGERAGVTAIEQVSDDADATHPEPMSDADAPEPRTPEGRGAPGDARRPTGPIRHLRLNRSALGNTIQVPALGREAEQSQAAEPEVSVAATAPSRGRLTETARGAQGSRTPGERRTGNPGRRQTDRQPGATQGDRRSARAKAARAEAAPLDMEPGGADPNRPADLPSPFVLSHKRFPTLTKLGRNLSHLAWLQQLDPVVGREREVVEALDVLHKRRSNNPCFVGPPGVGKTALAEGLAQQLVARHVPGKAPERVVIQVDFGAILAGTHLRGALADRLRSLAREVADAGGRVVVFIDEIHTLMGAGGGDGAHDAANELKAALARGEFPCIGATTVDEYRKHIEGDPAMERRFTAVHVEAPDAAATRRIVAGVADRYARHHGVAYLPEALDAAVRLSRRYIHDRHDPDRTLSVLDLAGAVARRAGTDVDRRAVAEVIARVARVPLEHLLLDDPERFLTLEHRLADEIIGQRHVLGALGETIRRSVAGFSGGRPIGSFLFLGPTGVGKTQVVKALARFLFGAADALTRFDMSEYSESHAVSRLIGAPPGYVGHQEGGQLTDAIRRRPYQVILFDEIEKSHRDIWNILLQLLDEGRLTDSRGRTVDCANTLVVLTSNLGAELLVPDGRRIGFAGAAPADLDARAAKALEKVRATFPPELFNRIEARLVFHPLTAEDVRAVGRLLAKERSAVLEREREIGFAVSDAALDHLATAHGGFDARLGARPMRRALAVAVESRLAELVLAGGIGAGDRVLVELGPEGLTFERVPAGS